MLLNAAAYYLAHCPSTVIIVQPNESMVKRLSRQRIEPMIELCAPLRALVAKARSKGGNEVALKTTRNGGVLAIASAQSAAALRSLPARVVLCDETDAYLADIGEGSPYDLAAARATTFGSLRKIAAISTPTEAGLSLIEKLFGETDQRRWFAPCPLCGFEQILAWENLRWEPKEPETARYRCAACNREWAETRKRDVIAAGRWKATAKGKTSARVRGYHFSALISPWQRWAELVAQYESATTPERKKTFTNLVLGEPWQGEQQTPLDADLLMQRREIYAAEVPMGACLLTCGVDTQDNRLEVEIVAWGRDEECWSISYHVLFGDPAQNDVWTELDQLLTREYRHESGFKLTISAACIDSGGHHSASVYEFCRQRFARKVWACKGASGFTRPIFPRRPSKGFNKAPLMMIGVDAGKEKVYSRLRVDSVGAAFNHFPLSYTREYFEQLTSERLTVRYSAGRPERVWIKPRDVRNECARCARAQSGRAARPVSVRLPAIRIGGTL